MQNCLKSFFLIWDPSLLTFDIKSWGWQKSWAPTLFLILQTFFFSI